MDDQHDSYVKLAGGFLVVVCVLLTAFFLAVSPKGPFVIDEGVYHLMVHNLTSGNGLFVWNGYDEFPSPELTLKFLQVHEGRLSGQYPFLYALILAPFYMLWGYQGLFLPNILGFGVTVALTFTLARQLFDDLRVALHAALVLVLATFFAEYASGIWPHSATAALGTAAYCLALLGARSSSRLVGLAASAGSGLALGLAIGFRLDAVLLVLGLALTFVRFGSARFRRTGAFLLGLAPPLLVMAVVNGRRFGVWSPFTYGSDGGLTNLATYAPLGVFLLVLMVATAIAILLLRRPGLLRLLSPDTGDRRLPERRNLRRLTAAGGAVVVAVGLVVWAEPLRTVLLRVLQGGWALVVDLRAYSGDAFQRGPGGGLIFYHTFKKAFLQSCPYVVVALLPLMGVWTKRTERKEVLVLLAAVLPLFAFFSFGEWHGGATFNMRYFLGAFPFMAVLTALGVRDLSEGIDAAEWPWTLLWLAVGGGAALLISASPPVVFGGGVTEAVREHLVLSTPLGIGAGLGLGIVLWTALGRPTSSRIRRGSLAFLAAGLTWACATAYGSDLLWSQALRSHHERLAAAGEEVIDDDSILFSGMPQAFSQLTRRRVRLAEPFSHAYEDFLPLMRYHLDAGRRVYVLEWDLEQFRAQGGKLPEGYLTVPVLVEDGTRIVEVRK